jgi:hypothetical protein
LGSLQLLPSKASSNPNYCLNILRLICEVSYGTSIEADWLTCDFTRGDDPTPYTNPNSAASLRSEQDLARRNRADLDVIKGASNIMAIP